jgi:hypothetical protein
MSSEGRGDLEEFMAIDADEIRKKRRQPKSRRQPAEDPTPDVIEIGPGLVRQGEHEYVLRPDGSMLVATVRAQVNISMTAKDEHLFRHMAEKEGRTLVSYVRELLKDRGLLE